MTYLLLLLTTPASFLSFCEGRPAPSAQLPVLSSTLTATEHLQSQSHSIEGSTTNPTNTTAEDGVSTRPDAHGPTRGADAPQLKQWSHSTTERKTFNVVLVS